MPLISLIEDGAARLAIWRADEPAELLASAARLTRDERLAFDSFRNDARRREWAAARHVLRNVLGVSDPVAYDAHGKPSISSGHVGISHSRGAVAVVVSGRPCSVDIEQVGDRVERVAPRVFSSAELAFAAGADMLTTCWCAKEALFKLCRAGQDDFRAEVEIQPFVPADTRIRCRLPRRGGVEIELRCASAAGCKVVWCVAESVLL